MSRNLTNVLHTHIILCTFCSIIFQKEINLLLFFFFTDSLSKEHHLCQSFNLWTFTPLLLPLVAKDSSRLKLFLKVTMNGKPWWVGFVCRVSLLHFINYILNNSVFIYLFSYLKIKFGLVGENNLMYTKLEF